MLRLNSLYALAYIPTEPWCLVDHDWNTNRDIITPLRQNRQFAALRELNNYVQGSNIAPPAYVQQCDVLKQFRKYI